MFTHLHTHSYYSLMDGFNSPLELVQTAKAQGQTSISVTDHGTLSGHRDLQKACLAEGVKPILGVEAYFSATDRFDKRGKAKREDGTSVYNHLIVLAKNQAGLKNLQKLSELAWTEGFYHKPRIDFEILEQYRDGLIVLSGCMNSVICQSLKEEKDGKEYWLNENDSKEHWAKAASWVKRFADVLGEDFYIEVQPHNPQKLNASLTSLAREAGLKTVVTADCHFARPEDRDAEEVMLIAGTNPKQDKEQDYKSTDGLEIIERLDRLYPGRTMSFTSKDSILDLFVMSKDEVVSACRQQVRDGVLDRDCVDNTQDIVEKVGDYEFYENLDLLPKISVNDPYTELRQRSFKGLEKRGLADRQEYKDRLEEELAVIEDKNFSRYFLIVSDLVRWAKSQGIMVGPGRGSAAGSLLCYCLRITEVDPIEDGLLFFRFINPERNDFPDIDLDFEDARRGEVKEYLRRKYGHAAAISTFGFWSDKGVIKDVARVLGVPYKEVNDLTKQFDTFEDFEALATMPDRKVGDQEVPANLVAEFHQTYPLVLEYAARLRGKIRNVGMHAAGMVVSSEPIEDYAPIETRKDPSNLVDERVPVLALDLKQAEELGLIKLDVLGLKALTVINSAVKMVERNKGKKIDLRKIGRDDREVLAEFGKGNTMGVFQAEATPYTNLLKEMGCDSFDDLVASTALVRPGAMNTVGVNYLARKRGKEKVSYAHPRLEPFLRETYGVIIYQEQVMQTAVELGGMKMTTADKLRKIIGKKLDASEFMPYYEEFMNGATQHVDKKVAEKLWHDFEAHAGYSFNKSHAVAYSMLTYWTMWLKVHYPLEFMCATLQAETDKNSRTMYLIESKRLGLNVKLPHVEHSALSTEIDGDALRMGLSDVKFISDKIGRVILDARPFGSYKSLEAFTFKKGSGLNTRVLGALSKVGAAEYPDHPLRGNERDFYYEYLNIPAFAESDLGAAEKYITRADKYDEDGTFIMRGLVTKIKRGKGWSRVEFIDESGTFTAFHDEQTAIVEGSQYLVLIGQNRICEFVAPDELDDLEHPLVKWMNTERLPGTVCLSFRPRKTKKGDMMATVVLSNAEKRLISALVFPRQFDTIYREVKPGKACEVFLGKTEDGTAFVKGVKH
jgi:DNA polymerase-3 subunit alpha